MHWVKKEHDERNWFAKMNDVLLYVEENLTGKVDYETVARIACISGYQFQRVFSFVAEIPFGEYIRRRRMTLAAFDLQNSSMKVIDIALKYGYESPEAFTRAFQSVHGVTPTMARGLGAKLKAYPKISFHISIKGDVEMDYRIERSGAFSLQGIAREFDAAEEDCFRAVPRFWNELCASGELDKMAAVAAQRSQPCAVRACSHLLDGSGTKTRYMIGIIDEGGDNLPGYAKLTVKAGTWAVFTSETYTMKESGAAMEKIMRRIFTEWLPTSKYKEGDYQQELYYTAGDGKIYCEVWKMIEE